MYPSLYKMKEGLPAGLPGAPIGPLSGVAGSCGWSGSYRPTVTTQPPSERTIGGWMPVRALNRWGET
jgi:hypothetical protein